MTHAELMRKLMRINEHGMTLPPELDKYIRAFPDDVTDDYETLYSGIERRALDGDMFSFAIVKLPDGRFVECSQPFAKRLGLDIVKQGSSSDIKGY
jgi:hypothetical protein